MCNSGDMGREIDFNEDDGGGVIIHHVGSVGRAGQVLLLIVFLYI